MTAIFTNLNYHLIFSTKGREALLEEELRHALFKALEEFASHAGGLLLGAGGGVEHVHLLVQYPPDVAPAEIQQQLKGASAGWLRGQSPGLAAFEWQTGYLCFTVSQSRLEHVEQYLANQPTHHAKWDFQREVVVLLDANHCPYDENELWK